jgi:hypothetical protein
VPPSHQTAGRSGRESNSLQVWVLVSLVFSAGCATRGPLATLHASPDKALVVGRVSVSYNQKNLTEQSELRFQQLTREKTGSTFYYGPGGAGPKIPTAYRLDASGWVVLTLEPGQWVLERIICRPGEQTGDMLYAFYREDTSFNLAQAGKIYYLGEVDVRWQGPMVKDWNLFRVLDPSGRPVNDGELELSIKNDPEGMQAELTRRYGGTPVVERAVLSGEPTEPPASAPEPLTPAK